MKVTRLALAVLTVAIFAACSSDVTGPSAKSNGASYNTSGGVGPRP